MRDEWPGDGATSVMPSHLLANQVRRRRLLSGMRTRWIMRPCAVKGGDQVWLCHGSVGVQNAFIALRQHKGRVSGGGI
jgi:hypothetical protein